MDKYELSMKMDELKRLAANGQFRKAGKVLETIEFKKIKNPKEMYVIIDILIENERYDQARELLVSISKKIKSRRIIHQLIDVSIKSGQIESAKKYMREFHKMAPDDPYNYVFQYQMAQLLGESYEKQIEILENLKQYEYLEKWAYELAKVYHRAGRDADCIAECEDLILWFGEGLFVEKAKLLKQYLIDEIMPSQLVEGQDLQKNCEIRSVFTPIAKREEPVKTQVDEDMQEESEKVHKTKEESEEFEQDELEEAEKKESEQDESEETEQEELGEYQQEDLEEAEQEELEEPQQEVLAESEQEASGDDEWEDLEKTTKEGFGKRRKVKKQGILGGVLSRFIIPKDSEISDHSQSFMDEESVSEDELPSEEPKVDSQETDMTSQRESRERERPLYQSAFDFIEDMELREQEEELDRIIEAANRKREQQALEENRINGVQEGLEERGQEVQEGWTEDDLLGQAQDVEESLPEGGLGTDVQELQEIWNRGVSEEGGQEVQEDCIEEGSEERGQEVQEVCIGEGLEERAQEVQEVCIEEGSEEKAQEVQKDCIGENSEERGQEVQEGFIGEVSEETTQEVQEYDEKEDESGDQEHIIANDQEVKELVEEMSNLIAGQIEELFFQEAETTVEEKEFDGATINPQKLKEELLAGDSCDSENYLNEVKESGSLEADCTGHAEFKSSVEFEAQQESTHSELFAEEDEPVSPEGIAEEDEPASLEGYAEEDEPTSPEDIAEEDEPASPESYAEEDEPASPESIAEEDEPASSESIVEEDELASSESIVEEDESASPESFEEENEQVSTETFNSKNTHDSDQEHEGYHRQNNHQETETQTEAQTEIQTEIQTDAEQLQPGMKESFTKVHKTQGNESKEAVLEDVDRLIKKRRQRATTKKLNEFVKERIGQETEAKDYLGQFAQIHSVGEDILRSLENIWAAHNSNITMFICGQNTFDETYFARRLAKLFYALNFIESKKLIVLNYEKFLALNFEPHMEKIKGGCIIVEEVMQVNERMRSQIQKLHENRCVVMLEINVRQNETKDREVVENSMSQEELHISRIVPLKEEMQLAGTTEVIWLEAFDVEELMGFAEEFLEEKEYTIEEEAKKYFTNYIEEVVKNRDSDTFCKVLEKISKAYHCANQRNKVELRNIAELGNYEDAAFMSIKYTDFANEN